MVSERGFPLGTVAAVATSEILSNPNVVKVVTADDGRAMYFSRAAIPFLRSAEDAELQHAALRQHLGVYAYTPATLRQWVELPEHPLERIERLEQLRALAAGIPIGVALIDEPVRPGIDTAEDLERANREWRDFSIG
jgi:3-deoxy-manno-octulosonate cytidylyltransferase (CMP-KDO synthetase)